MISQGARLSDMSNQFIKQAFYAFMSPPQQFLKMEAKGALINY